MTFFFVAIHDGGISDALDIIVKHVKQFSTLDSAISTTTTTTTTLLDQSTKSSSSELNVIGDDPSKEKSNKSNALRQSDTDKSMPIRIAIIGQVWNCLFYV